MAPGACGGFGTAGFRVRGAFRRAAGVIGFAFPRALGVAFGEAFPAFAGPLGFTAALPVAFFRVAAFVATFLLTALFPAFAAAFSFRAVPLIALLATEIPVLTALVGFEAAIRVPVLATAFFAVFTALFALPAVLVTAFLLDAAFAFTAAFFFGAAFVVAVVRAMPFLAPALLVAAFPAFTGLFGLVDFFMVLVLGRPRQGSTGTRMDPVSRSMIVHFPTGQLDGTASRTAHEKSCHLGHRSGDPGGSCHFQRQSRRTFQWMKGPVLNGVLSCLVSRISTSLDVTRST
ncbi:MAG: hypothetical protein KDC01_10855 [Flavobacteriales bacterium]|nr:hypothetical protein [Flavobacteriales bacterium]